MVCIWRYYFPCLGAASKKSSTFGWVVGAVGGFQARPQLSAKKLPLFVFASNSMQKPSKRGKKTIKLTNMCTPPLSGIISHTSTTTGEGGGSGHHHPKVPLFWRRPLPVHRCRQPSEECNNMAERIKKESSVFSTSNTGCSLIIVCFSKISKYIPDPGLSWFFLSVYTGLHD